MNEEIKTISEKEYINLPLKERTILLSEMKDKEKYEFLKNIPKKDLTENEKLFLMKMEYILYEEQIQKNQEKKKKEWTKSILNPIKFSLEKIYVKNNEEIFDNEIDLKLSAFLIKILEEPNLYEKIKNLNYNEYVFKNTKNLIDRIENKRTYVRKEKVINEISNNDIQNNGEITNE